MSLAIQYNMKRKKPQSQACAHGGEASCMEGCYAKGGFASKKKVAEGELNGKKMDVIAGASKDPGPPIKKNERMEAYKKRTGKYAEGGDTTDPTFEGPHIVDRIIAKRMSEGGRVANDTDVVADELPNEFDDLVLRDNLESSYTGADSGDYLGAPDEDDSRLDMISRIMRKRKASTA